MEQWRPVVGFEGRYEVSDAGRVRSLPRLIRQKARSGTEYTLRKSGRLLRSGVASNGYPTVALGRGNTRTLHSLVTEAFIGPRPSGQEVRHLDGDRKNPRLSNLTYGTRTENILDAVAHGTWMSEKRAAHMRRIGFGARRA
jgi:hypothetical protein